MSIKFRVICAIVFALIFISTSCSQPKYLVKGLSLPPGSTEVSFEGEGNGLNKLPFPVPGVGNVEKSITVNFDCSKNWDSVVSHVNGCMERAGYENLSSQLGNLTGLEGAAGNLAKANKMMRTYTKQGGKFAVLLINNNWLGDSTGMPGINLANADYTLVVVESDGDE